MIPERMNQEQANGIVTDLKAELRGFIVVSESARPRSFLLFAPDSPRHRIQVLPAFLAAVPFEQIHSFFIVEETHCFGA